ncbi:MAG: hypothetical protein ACUVX8_06390 [Candidatus Zipacnadales bacterium]
MIATWIILSATLSLEPSSAQGLTLRIDPDDIGISKMIPKVNDRVTLLVPVVNTGPQPVAARCILRGQVTHDNGMQTNLGAQDVVVELQPGGKQDIALTWQPNETGFYGLIFRLTREGKELAQAEFGPVAVTAHDLYFVWFGTPREFRWCNVPTTVKAEDASWWLRRGAIPCHWRGGVCYKERDQSWFEEHYGSAQWIAIDEIGGPGPETDKFVAALRALKAQQPERFTAVWFMGAHQYWGDVTDVVDLFIPEVYLNYRGNNLSLFDGYLWRIRQAGVVSRTVFGLGINQIKDDDSGEVRVSPTKEDVLRQIRYIKRIAPEMPGVGFFTSYTAPEGVAEYADELCGEYFVKPLLTIVDERVTIEPGTPLHARFTIGNYGGMTAQNVTVKVTQRSREGKTLSEHDLTIRTLPVGEQRELSATLQNHKGLAIVTVEILSSPQYSLLDGRVEEPMLSQQGVAPELGTPLAVVGMVPWEGGSRMDVPVSWMLKGQYTPVRVMELEDDSSPANCPALSLTEGGCTLLRWVVTGTTASGERRYFVLLAGEEQSGIPAPILRPRPQEEGALCVQTPHYEAVLNVETDALTSLKPAGSQTELLKSPWTLHCIGHQGFGKPITVQMGGWTAITIPFESAQARGFSRYVFSSNTPAIEIERRFEPKGALAVKSAGDRCELEQRGGTYALQPGWGAPVSRGRLQNSSEYRDLLFGFLGGVPTEDNSRRAGWLEFCWEKQWDAGLGVVVAERWRDAAFASYDVTRLYDGSDWLEIVYVWGTETTLTREQTCRHFLIPHGYLDLGETSVPPAQAVWETLQRPLREIVG